MILMVNLVLIRAKLIILYMDLLSAVPVSPLCQSIPLSPGWSNPLGLNGLWSLVGPVLNYMGEFKRRDCSPDKTHPGGTVPPDKTHTGGTVSPDKTHPGGTIPPYKR